MEQRENVLASESQMYYTFIHPFYKPRYQRLIGVLYSFFLG